MKSGSDNGLASSDDTQIIKTKVDQDKWHYMASQTHTGLKYERPRFTFTGQRECAWIAWRNLGTTSLRKPEISLDGNVCLYIYISAGPFY